MLIPRKKRLPPPFWGEFPGSPSGYFSPPPPPFPAPSNDESDEVPPSPLISTASGSIDSAANAQRRVQWFRTFMGVRVHLDDTTDPDHSITYNTIGDWGASNADRDANVRGHDFYYWHNWDWKHHDHDHDHDHDHH